MSLFNRLSIRLRHESTISVWWTGGSTKNRASWHRLESVRKSGRDLWKTRIGSSGSSGIRRREWRESREVEISDGESKSSRSSERLWIESGLKTNRTAPTTDLNRRYTSWFPCFWWSEPK